VGQDRKTDNEAIKPSMSDNNGAVMNKAEVKNLFNRYKNIFKQQPTITDIYRHKIEVTDEKKFVHKSYPIPMHYQERVGNEVQRMLEQGIIERSNSNFLNPVVVLRKRMVISAYV
jgi:hypothetical protein